LALLVKFVVGSCGSGQGPMTDSGGHSNEPECSIKGGELLD